MHFITYLSVLSAIAATTSLTFKRFASVDVKTFASSFDETAVGSIYFSTNDPSGNYAVSASINSSGHLTPSCATSTQGNGSHGIGIPSALGDPLFAQGSVAVSQSSGLVATVNAGSNTVQLFSVDPLISSILQPLGSPMPTGGQFPISAAFNSAGDMLCVISGGVGASVRCFSVNPSWGLTIGSTRNLSLNTATPPTGIPDSVSTLRFTPDDSTLLAVVKGRAGVASDPSVFYSWPVTSTKTAALSSNGTRSLVSSTGAQPFSITFIPGRNAFLAADSNHGADVFDYSLGLGTGKITTAVLNITNQSASCWSTFSPKSGNFYIADLSHNFISEVNLDANLKPSLVKQYPSPVAGGGVNEMTVATINGVDYLYALLPAPNATSVGVLRIDGPSNASWAQIVDFAVPAAATNLSLLFTHVAGMNVYLD